MLTARHLILTLCVVRVASQEQLGDECEGGDENGTNTWTGTCVQAELCNYAWTLLTKNEVHPPTCFFEGTKRIVCCPKSDRSYELGTLRPIFRASVDGTLRSSDVVCSYEGVLPLICRNVVKETVIPEDVDPCGHLRLFTKEGDHPLLRRCDLNTRYAYPCQLNNVTKTYERTNVCANDDFYKIAQGQAALPNEFPHMALLGYAPIEKDLLTTDVVWQGGGSLITAKYILTAAHVVATNQDINGNLRYALLGVTLKKNSNKGVWATIANYIIHKNYDVSYPKVNDIALLELTAEVNFGSSIRPICLPVPGINTSRSRYIAGWGKTEGTNARTTNELKKAELTEVDQSACHEFNSAVFAFNKTTMICAKGIVDASTGLTADSCSGDSGGPLMAFAKDIRCSYVILGVVSFGSQNCGQGKPAVYTNVEAYLPWITQYVFGYIDINAAPENFT